MDIELEAARTLSLLSERPHEIMHDGKSYVAYTGYILTYSTFSTIFMWTIAGPKIYHSIWRDREGAIQEVRDLNPQDAQLPTMDDSYVGQYISDRFRATLGSKTSEEVEYLIQGMFLPDTQGD